MTQDSSRLTRNLAAATVIVALGLFAFMPATDAIAATSSPTPQLTSGGDGGGAPWCQFNDSFWTSGGSVYGQAVWWCNFYTWMNEASHVDFVAVGDPPRGEIATTASAYWNDALSNTTSTTLVPGTDEYYIVQAGWAQGGGGFSVNDFAPGPRYTGT